MKRIFTIIILVIFCSTLTLQAATFHDFQANNIKGELIDMSSFAGKRLLVVNVASLCGFTYQYADLQSLYEQFGGPQFEIIAFPANNFQNQEPDSDSTIEEFCKSKYGVTFTMMSKISVRGNDMHDIYKWLTQKSENGVQDAPIKWNFQKFMIDENGNWIDVISHQESPTSIKITSWIYDYVSIEENISKSDINIYPNPVKDILWIESEEELTKVKIVDLFGVNLIDINYPAQPSEIRLNVSNLCQGIYVMIIIADDEISIKKFIIAE